MEGRLIFSYAAAFAGCAAAGSVAGFLFVAGALRRSVRPSLLILVMAAVVGCGAALTAVLGGWDVMEDVWRKGDKFGGFASICR
jgi:hypothetical protein